MAVKEDEDKRKDALYGWLILQDGWTHLMDSFNNMPIDSVAMEDIDPEWADRYEDAMSRLKAVIDEVYDE